jgi:coenzyme F420-0:L-glutamate ligase/coenzyme F420-1:gamma-L-glutamate ligase
MVDEMELVPIKVEHLIREGDDLPEIIVAALRRYGVKLKNGDVVVVAQSAVSKAEGRIVNLEQVKPSAEAVRIAKRTGKDPREVEVILREAEEIVRAAHVVIARTKHGFVCGNAGVDESNAPPGCVTVLPEDPDASAARIRERLEREFGAEVAVIVSDTQGRAFRLGALGCAIGIAGMEPLMSFKGRKDLWGRELKSTVVCPADAIAAAAVLVMGEAGEGTPVVVVRGAPYRPGEGSARELVRPKEKDLFA